MNAGMKNGINLLMILVLFISCVQEKEDNNVLRRVEACMELFPDSALSLLSQIECPECMRGQQRADYALLLTQALDKNYLDNLQSDSLIMIAVEYYKYCEMPKKKEDILTIKLLTGAGEIQGIRFESKDNGETWAYDGISVE